MSTALRRRIAVILVWVLAMTGSAAAFSACRHGDATPDVSVADQHAGHGANHAGTDQPDTNSVIGAGCGCGCACAGNCNHVCHTTTLPLLVTTVIQLTDIALPMGTRAVAASPSTHPPLRPPTASL